MELKDTRNLHTSVETRVTPVSERNDPKNHKVYDILFPPKEDEANPNIESKNLIIIFLYLFLVHL